MSITAERIITRVEMLARINALYGIDDPRRWEAKLALLDALDGDEPQQAEQSRPPALGAAAHVELPLRACMPWCDMRDGHPECFGLEDQSCWEIAEYVELSLEVPVDNNSPQRFGVMARRRPRQPGHVLVHLDGMKLQPRVPDSYNVLDHEVMFTPDEAERLGRRLIASAELARSTHPPES